MSFPDKSAIEYWNESVERQRRIIQEEMDYAFLHGELPPDCVVWHEDEE